MKTQRKHIKNRGSCIPGFSFRTNTPIRITNGRFQIRLIHNSTWASIGAYGISHDKNTACVHIGK